MELGVTSEAERSLGLHEELVMWLLLLLLRWLFTDDEDVADVDEEDEEEEEVNLLSENGRNGGNMDGDKKRASERVLILINSRWIRILNVR